MNWIEVLLVLLFLLFPLLQQLLSKKSAPPPVEREADPEYDDEQWELPQMPPASGEYPYDPYRKAGEIADAEVVDEKQADELAQLQSRLPAGYTPEAVRVSTPVVSMEPLVVERPVSTKRRAVPAAIAPPVRPRRSAVRTALRLDRPSELRHAILVAEVLGPPRSLD